MPHFAARKRLWNGASTQAAPHPVPYMKAKPEMVRHFESVSDHHSIHPSDAPRPEGTRYPLSPWSPFRMVVSTRLLLSRAAASLDLRMVPITE
jgi:hypothetical protein